MRIAEALLHRERRRSDFSHWLCKSLWEHNYPHKTCIPEGPERTACLKAKRLICRCSYYMISGWHRFKCYKILCREELMKGWYSWWHVMKVSEWREIITLVQPCQWAFKASLKKNKKQSLSFQSHFIHWTETTCWQLYCLTVYYCLATFS